MQRAKRQILVVGVLVVALASQTLAADVGRVLRSTAFPGMGQLADDQTARGLLYMGGEAVLLSLMFNQIAKKAAYDRNTEFLKVDLDRAATYEEKQAILKEWNTSIDNSDKASTYTFVFAGAAGAWWIWNIVDALIFAPRNKTEESLYNTIKDNTLVSVGPEKAQVSYRIKF
jgi:hypothetical protein